MAFQTNHTAPGGFVAGAQLKDGSPLGDWLWYDLAAGTGTIRVYLRARRIGRTDRFAVEQKLGTGGWALVGRESLRQYAETAPPTASDNASPDVTKTYTNMQAWLDYVATTAELQALGYTTGGPINTVPNSFLIQFYMDADGKVKPYFDPIDPAKQQAELNDLLKSSLVATQASLTGRSLDGNGTGTGSTNWLRVGLVVVGVALGGFLIWKLVKK